MAAEAEGQRRTEAKEEVEESAERRLREEDEDEEERREGELLNSRDLVLRGVCFSIVVST